MPSSTAPPTFVDLHSHLLPSVDDGAGSWEEALRMARMATSDGTATMLATPHQLGNYAKTSCDLIRARTTQLQSYLIAHDVPLTVLPGAVVRAEPAMLDRLRRDEVMTLADRGKHLLLELPHEEYQPINNLVATLSSNGITPILSHPERNAGLLKRPQPLRHLVELGCLLQVTADSLNGTFGTGVKQMAEWMLRENLVHVVASDAHGFRSRRPLLAAAYHRTLHLTNRELADALFHHNPLCIANASDPAELPRWQKPPKLRWWPWRRAA